MYNQESDKNKKCLSVGYFGTLCEIKNLCNHLWLHQSEFSTHLCQISPILFSLKKYVEKCYTKKIKSIKNMQILTT